jgi:hypothetical protein
MAGFIPAIHVFVSRDEILDVDGRDKPGHDDCEYYRLRRNNSNYYFFAGAILESAGLAASGLAAASAGWSMRSTLAVSRSLAT